MSAPGAHQKKRAPQRPLLPKPANLLRLEPVPDQERVPVRAVAGCERSGTIANSVSPGVGVAIVPDVAEFD